MVGDILSKFLLVRRRLRGGFFSHFPLYFAVKFSNYFKSDKMLSNQLKSEIKKRLTSKFDLEKIILFGSQARGTANNKSDVDLLLIGEVKYDRYQMMTDILRSLGKMNYAFDVIILTADEFEEHKYIPGTVARYAYKEGKIIYER
jgi:predicted nucleotidyltransferase